MDWFSVTLPVATVAGTPSRQADTGMVEFASDEFLYNPAETCQNRGHWKLAGLWEELICVVVFSDASFAYCWRLEVVFASA